MKASRLIVACVLSAAPFATAAEVETGDSLAEVRNALGAPRGQVTLDGRQVLYYDRGEVELLADTVTRVAMRTPEEQAAIDAREARSREERVARLTQLQADGAALRDRKLADENFKNAPLAYQISYWENFSRSYPGVSVREPLAIARMQFNEQLAVQRANAEQEARIADLEERLARSESGDYGPWYTSGAYYGYGYGRRYHYSGSYPLDLSTLRYDFGTTTNAPYETPHGSPYETPHGSPYVTPSGSPYSTPTSINFDYYYKPSSRFDWTKERVDHRQHGKQNDRGRDQVANRNGRSGPGRY